jgi:hypothetical protein
MPPNGMLTATGLTDGIVSLHPLRADYAAPMYEAVCESLEELKPWMSWAHDDYDRKETDWHTGP